MTEMFTKLVEVFSTGAFTILSIAGEALGRTAADKMLALTPADRVARVKYLMNASSRWGFGRYRLLELRTSPHLRLRFRLYKCPLYEGETPGRGAEAFRYYLKSFFKSYFSTVFEADVECEEVKCVAEGHAYCEFCVEERPAGGPKA